jgi:hypothetical protein
MLPESLLAAPQKPFGGAANHVRRLLAKRGAAAGC